jgi:hypothetical protein
MSLKDRIEEINLECDGGYRERIKLTNEAKQKMIRELLAQEKFIGDPPPDDERAATRQETKDLIYYTFLDTVRMVATNNKKSALMLLRCWHAYQAHHTASVQKKFAEQKSKIDKIKKMINHLSSIAEKSLLTDQEKDAAMADMR